MFYNDEHIGVGIHCLFLLQGLAGTSNQRISKKRFHAFSIFIPTGRLEPMSHKLFNTMKNKLILICAILYSMQMMAANLVVEHRSGADLLQDVAIIGKWVYVGDNLQLLDKAGNVLATEPLSNIKKITFSISGTTTEVESASANSIIVYPNPTHDVLIITGINTQTLRVYDLQGRLLQTEIGTQINVSNLAVGTYLLQIGTQIVRFIKQ